MTAASGPGLPVSGVVGRVGVDSSDGRRIAPGGLVLPDQPIPLMAVGAPGLGHDGAKLAGLLEQLRVDEDGAVHARGHTFAEPQVQVPAGEYECGMDLRNVTNLLLHPETGGPFTDEDWQRLFVGGQDDPPEPVHLTERGELMAVTLYLPGSTARAVWPGVTMRVGEDR